MKSKLTYTLLFTFFALLMFTGCQDEAIDPNTPNEQETLIPSSTLVNLMTQTTANNGAVDNVIDESSCFTVELPVTVIVNGITITIEDIEDIEELEELLEELGENEDLLELVFPITIIFNDYTELVIENLEQLEALIDECIDDEDDVIECVDFQYPISFSVFNPQFVLIDTVVIENDEQLYEFLDTLDDENEALIVSLNYPVTLEYANGETVEVNSNEELANAIEAAGEDCEGNEALECDEDEIAEKLVTCSWIYEYDDFEYEIVFNEDGTLEILEGDATSAIGGNWELSSTDEGVLITFSELTAFEETLGGSWLIVDCDPEELELVRGDDEIELYRNCEDDVNCSAQEINEDLQECSWYFASNLIGNDYYNQFYFTPNGQVFIVDGNNEVQVGVWNLEVEGDYTYLVLDMEEPYQALSVAWKIIECDDDRLELIDIGSDGHLVLEQDCEEEENIFECFASFDAVITKCDENDDGIEMFDLTIAYANCTPFAEEVTYHETLADADAGVNPIASPEVYTNIVNPQTIYVRVEDDNGNHEVFELSLIVEDCGTEGCSEEDVDAFLISCIWNIVNYNGSDDFMIYNLDFEAETGIVVIYNNEVTIDASWSTSQSEDGVIVTFSNVAGPNIQAITGEWLVVECEEGRIELHRGNEEVMVLERNCD